MTSAQILWADFEVKTANLYQASENVYLNASFESQLPNDALEILTKGLPIRIVFELEVTKPRRYWIDKTISENHYSFILQHDPITDRYELTRLDTDSILSYATPHLAMESLLYLSNLLVMPKTDESTFNTYSARLRMKLDVRNFPEPMQYLSQYWGDWVRTSDWYYWAIRESKLLIENNEPAIIVNDPALLINNQSEAVDNLDSESVTSEPDQQNSIESDSGDE